MEATTNRIEIKDWFFTILSEKQQIFKLNIDQFDWTEPLYWIEFN